MCHKTHARSSDGPSFQHHTIALQQQAPRATRAAPQKTREGRGGVNLAAFRLAQINRLLSHRKGSGLAEEPQGDLVDIVAGLFVGLRGWPGNLRGWIKRRAPGFNPAELEALITCTETTTRIHWDGVLVGWIVRLTAVEATRLKITTMLPCDLSRAEIEASRKAQRNQKRKERRRAAGAKDRMESAAKNKPWVAKGISRSTYYARKKKQEVRTVVALRLKEKEKARDRNSPTTHHDRAGLSAPARAA